MTKLSNTMLSFVDNIDFDDKAELIREVKRMYHESKNNLIFREFAEEALRQIYNTREQDILAYKTNE